MSGLVYSQERGLLQCSRSKKSYVCSQTNLPSHMQVWVIALECFEREVRRYEQSGDLSEI